MVPAVVMGVPTVEAIPEVDGWYPKPPRPLHKPHFLPQLCSQVLWCPSGLSPPRVRSPQHRAGSELQPRDVQREAAHPCQPEMTGLPSPGGAAPGTPNPLPTDQQWDISQETHSSCLPSYTGTPGRTFCSSPNLGTGTVISGFTFAASTRADDDWVKTMQVWLPPGKAGQTLLHSAFSHQHHCMLGGEHTQARQYWAPQRRVCPRLSSRFWQGRTCQPPQALFPLEFAMELGSKRGHGTLAVESCPHFARWLRGHPAEQPAWREAPMCMLKSLHLPAATWSQNIEPIFQVKKLRVGVVY